MRLSIAEFGRLTPKQFGAFIHRLEMKDEKRYIAAGIIAATVSNTAPFADPNRQPADPLDFVPGLSQKRKRRQARQMSLAEQIKVLTGAFGCGPEMKMNNEIS